jgi:MFS family permease
VAVVLATCSRLPQTDSEPEPFLARTRAGLRYARTNRVARFLIGGESLAVIFFTLIVPIEIVYAAETLGTDDLGYGILLSSWGAGIVLGSLVFLTVRRRSVSTLILSSSLAIGCAYLGMAVARELWLACVFSVIGGLGNGVQWVSVMTALQESTPRDLQARITGLLESISSAMTGVGFLLGGIVTALASPPTAFAISGIGVALLVLLAAVFRVIPDSTGDPGERTRFEGGAPEMAEASRGQE